MRRRNVFHIISFDEKYEQINSGTNLDMPYLILLLRQISCWSFMYQNLEFWVSYEYSKCVTNSHIYLSICVFYYLLQIVNFGFIKKYNP